MNQAFIDLQSMADTDDGDASNNASEKKGVSFRDLVDSYFKFAEKPPAGFDVSKWVKKWQGDPDWRKLALKPIGDDREDRRAGLYKLSELLEYLKTVHNTPPTILKKIAGSLKGRLRLPK